MFSRVNVAPIVSDFWSAFKPYKGKNNSGKNNSFVGLFMFILIPCIFAAVMLRMGFNIEHEKAVLFLSVYSVFGSLFFGLQIFIFDIITRVSSLPLTKRSAELRIGKFRYIALSISFEILVCLASILTLMSSEILDIDGLIGMVTSFFVFYLFVVFLMGLLVVLKGVHRLLLEEIEFQVREVESRS